MSNAPEVSVIVPAYNAEDYVGEAVGSVLAQTIAPERVEVIVIDDGSTDGTAAVLADLAAKEPRVRVLTQENSGTPGGARNPGIDVARGTFVFFLDADDLLPEHSLERMVDVAIDEGSDVVLGKLGSTDGRPVPTGMFKRTVLDADLVEDRVFNTLGPTKLIRREIIERLDLHFPTDQTVGEDEPFMAAVYLNARKISVLADEVYYVARYRADGENMTLAQRDSASHAIVALRVAEVIERYTEPGDRRDALLKRPFGRPLARALGTRWLTLRAAEQVRLTTEIRDAVGYLYTPGLRALLPGATAAKLDLLMAGDLDDLATLIEHLGGGDPAAVTWEDGEFRRVLPAEVEALMPKDLRRVAPPAMTARLEALEVEGTGVSVTVSLVLARFQGVPDEVVLRLRKRDTEDEREMHIVHQDLAGGPGKYLVQGHVDALSRGVWDVYAVPRFGSWEKALRVGADRARTIAPEGASNLVDAPSAQDRVVAYFTKGYGNLSIDSGSMLHKNAAHAEVVGLSLDENGRALVLVRTSVEPAVGDEYFAQITGTVRYAGRQLLPATRMGDRLIGLRLPLTESMVGAALTLTAVLGGVSTPLPIRGASYWSARAAGFGLESTESGGVEVTPAPAAPVSPASGPERDTLRARFRRAAADPIGTVGASRAGGIVKELPVVGPATRSLAHALRRGRR
ncbi:MAG TPA: glycosyltransferase family 2 protein [Brevibacterium sp.]|nr:glycosyltransferase family 2 protein [Brevibacterium sp.]